MTIRMQRWHLAAALVASLALVSLTPAMQAAEADKNIWSDEPAETQRRFKLTDERIEEFLDQLAEAHPDRAAELRKLRKSNPEQFRKELRETFAERRRVGGHPGDEPRGEGRGGARERPGRGPGRMGGRPEMEAGPGPRSGGSLGGRGGRRERWRERIQERHEEYIEWLKDNYPEKAKKLVQLREKNPDEYIKHVMASRERYGDIMEAQERSPELAEVLKEELELKRDRAKLLEKIRSDKGKQRKDLIQKLEEVVNTRFDLIVRKKQLRYEHLLRRLERLQKEVKQREAEVEKLKSKKAQFIKERLEELTSKAEKMNWD